MNARTPLAFVDIRTTHQDPEHGNVWEIAVIRRCEDGTDTEYLWQVRPDLAVAHPETLATGGFHERFAVPDGWAAIEIFPSGPPMRLTLPETLFDLQTSLRRAVLIGPNPGSSIAFLTKLLRAHRRKLPWNQQPVDITTLVTGYHYGQAAGGTHRGDSTLTADYPTPPHRTYDLSRTVGVEPPTKNTALDTACWARNVWDTVTTLAVAPATADN